MTAPGPTLPDPRQAAVAVSNARWRSIFAVLALVVPSLLGALFQRQNMRLRSLADHGRETTATVIALDPGGVTYAYAIDGRIYEWNVRADQAPSQRGARFAATYLPEDPSLSRPVSPYTDAHRVAEMHPVITVGMPLGLFVFFFGAALLCHRAP